MSTRFQLAVFLFDPRRKELDVCSPLFDVEQEDVPPRPVQMICQVEDLPPEAFASG
jgi:hypothetical protein